jgi:hypothetical protein
LTAIQYIIVLYKICPFTIVLMIDHQAECSNGAADSSAMIRKSLWRLPLQRISALSWSFRLNSLRFPDLPGSQKHSPDKELLIP